MEKYNIASELILKSNKIKNRQNLIHVISKKMGSLENDFKKKNKPASRKIPKKTQELIKSKKFFSEKMGKDEAALEGALNLAKFGQYKRALKELKNLISVDSIRVNAAKNIVRCYMALSAPDDAIAQYNKWILSNLFENDQLEKVRFFLKSSLRKKGIKKTLPEPKKTAKIEHPDFEEKEEEVPDISSIVIMLDKGPQKGKAIELDVSFQTGNIINVIMPGRDHGRIKNLNIGFKINDIQFFSPIAIFKGSGIVSNMTYIKSGPKKGDCSLDIKVVNI
ncbi:MAG: tetratricopeptide repeat protein [Deltaproteobacteria bacterium]|nr:tetratricopeptide repeat protein [Deltaproteobacteria bacterium]